MSWIGAFFLVFVVSTPSWALTIRDDASALLTDGQPGLDHVLDPPAQGLVFMNLTQEGEVALDAAQGVFHGLGPVGGPAGAAPDLSATGWELIWHAATASLIADPFAEQILFIGEVWDVTSAVTSITFLGSTSDPDPRTTLLVEWDFSGLSIVVDGGYLALRPVHDVAADGELRSTQSTSAVGPSAPSDWYCSGPNDCVVLGTRHGWTLEGTPVPEPTTAMLVGTGLVALGTGRRRSPRVRS